MNEKQKADYLERIGFSLTGRMDAKNLNALIRAHLESVPFENLDVVEQKQVPDLSEETLFDKIVRRKRGGYCFELNTLFLRLLEAVGVEAYPVAARVLWGRDYIPPISHVGLSASIDGRKCFCDVGYGGPGPKGLLYLEEGEQRIADEDFRVQIPEEGHFFIERRGKDQWRKVLSFYDSPFEEVDFQILNFYCARNEKVLFTQKRVVNLCTSSGSKALTDMELTVREGERIYRKMCRDKDELRGVLQREFGICSGLG